MDIADIIVLVIASVFAAFFLFVLILSLLEKQYLAGDLEPAIKDSGLIEDKYYSESKEDALNCGFIHCGDFSTKKNTSLVKGLSSFWVTPDGLSALEIVYGAFKGTTLRRCRLYSQMPDGTVLVTSDNAVSIDITGKTLTKIWLNAPIAELLDRHHERIETLNGFLQQIDPDNILDWFESIELTRGERMVAAKYGYWINPEKTQFRFNLRGTLKNFKRSFIDQSNKLSEQTHRKAIKRAGKRMRRVDTKR